MSTIADDWPTFVRDWCLGVEPSFNQADARRALAALKSLWPERFERTLGFGGRGIGVVSPAIHLGSTLARTSDCVGFRSVLQRAVGGERAAVSELHFAAKLRVVGFTPSFSVDIGGKNLDIAIEVDGVKIFCEVVTPDRSDLEKEAHNMVTRAQRVLGAKEGQHLEVQLLTFPTEAVIASVREGIDTSPAGDWVEIPGVARWRREEHADSGRRSQFSWPANEHRAERLISSEYHHFAAIVPFVLVVDTLTSSLPPEGWTQAFAKAFQPTRNRRLGATVAYRDYVLAGESDYRAIVQVLANRFATHVVPLRLLTAIASISRPLPAPPDPAST